jgi:hypothetical protein
MRNGLEVLMYLIETEAPEEVMEDMRRLLDEAWKKSLTEEQEAWWNSTPPSKYLN